jgi:hypothetical protein
MSDARCTRGPVCKMGKKTHTSIQVQRRQSDIPRAMVLTASFALLCPQNLAEWANGRFSPTARRWI